MGDCNDTDEIVDALQYINYVYENIHKEDYSLSRRIGPIYFGCGGFEMEDRFPLFIAN